MTRTFTKKISTDLSFYPQISNAIKFTENSPKRQIDVVIDLSSSPPGSGSCAQPPSSTIALPDQGQVLYLYGTVQDSGPGLKEHDLHKLFLKFSQASTESQRVFGGSGIGLYICRSLLRLMGGDVEVSSSPGTVGCCK